MLVIAAIVSGLLTFAVLFIAESVRNDDGRFLLLGNVLMFVAVLVIVVALS